LKDSSLELNKREVSVLFGPSGSGKTSLCRNLSLLDYPDKGEIEIFGNTYSFPTKGEFKKLPYPQIGFVYQQLFLWPHLTNKQNILLALGNNAESHQKQFEELLELLEIKDVVERYPNEVSIGQKQRVAIARALILNPNFIFLDEITSALDIVQTKQIISLIETLRNKNVGVLIVTHNLEMFRKVADKMIFLSKGEIIEKGDDIFHNPHSQELINFLS
jgi:ABC-type polar amino acid transport system ATPase subunit